MKTKLLMTLLGGLLGSSFAMAATSVSDYTLLTSSNLAGNYTLVDSGFQLSNGSDWLGSSNYLSNTTATASGAAFQSPLGQWYQPTEFVTLSSYDYNYQSFTQTTRSIFVQTTAQVTNSFIDLTVNTDSAMNFSVYAAGVNGSTTTPRGFTQVVNPSLGLMIDGQQVATNTYANTQNGYNTWQGTQDGMGTASFQAVAEAGDGSYLTNLSLNLSTNKVLGAITSQNFSYESNRWTSNVAIAAPVPEPETYAMMLAGLGLMGAVARRRKQNKG